MVTACVEDARPPTLLTGRMQQGKRKPYAPGNSVCSRSLFRVQVAVVGVLAFKGLHAFKGLDGRSQVELTTVYDAVRAHPPLSVRRVLEAGLSAGTLPATTQLPDGPPNNNVCHGRLLIVVCTPVCTDAR